MKKMMILSALALLIGGASLAADLPPGKWWHQPEIADRLQLSEEQQGRLDGVFRQAASELIDRRAEVALHR